MKLEGISMQGVDDECAVESKSERYKERVQY